MRVATVFTVSLAGAALLLLQFSGLHMHAGETTHSAELHGAHTHASSDESHGHGHDADVDVSFFELGTGVAKNMPVILSSVAPMPLPGWVRTGFDTLADNSSFVQRRFRWRPPLRAPPFTP